MFTCSVCQEWFTASSHVSALHCGHLYHEVCIATWLKGHNTCPQCRCKLREKSFRVYFNVDQDSSELIPSDLLDKLDSVTSKLEAANEQCKSFETLLSTEKEMNKLQRRMLMEKESELEDVKSVNMQLKLKLVELDRLQQEAKTMKEEFDKIKKETDQYKGVKEMLSGTAASVSKLLSTTPRSPASFRQLCTYIEVLKQQMDKSKQKIAQLSSEKLTDAKEIQILKATVLNLKKRASNTGNSPRLSQSLTASPKPRFLSDKEDAAGARKSAELDDDIVEILGVPIKKPLADSVNYTNLGARPITVATSRTTVTKSTAVKRGPTVFNGMGGSAGVSLSNPTPRDEFLAITAKRPKTSTATKPASSKLNASSLRAPHWI